MTKETHNPIIGYHAYDQAYHIITPDGTLNPVFSSPKRARQAAAAYGQGDAVVDVLALHLNGILSIIWQDTEDIALDGRAAQRFVKACKKRGISINKQEQKEIRVVETRPVYSCRQLLAV